MKACIITVVANSLHLMSLSRKKEKKKKGTQDEILLMLLEAETLADS